MSEFRFQIFDKRIDISEILVIDTGIHFRDSSFFVRFHLAHERVCSRIMRSGFVTGFIGILAEESPYARVFVLFGIIRGFRIREPGSTLIFGLHVQRSKRARFVIIALRLHLFRRFIRCRVGDFLRGGNRLRIVRRERNQKIVYVAVRIVFRRFGNVQNEFACRKRADRGLEIIDVFIVRFLLRRTHFLIARAKIFVVEFRRSRFVQIVGKFRDQRLFQLGKKFHVVVIHFEEIRRLDFVRIDQPVGYEIRKELIIRRNSGTSGGIFHFFVSRAGIGRIVARINFVIFHVIIGFFRIDVRGNGTRRFVRAFDRIVVAVFRADKTRFRRIERRIHRLFKIVYGAIVFVVVLRRGAAVGEEIFDREDLRSLHGFHVFEFALLRFHVFFVAVYGERIVLFVEEIGHRVLHGDFTRHQRIHQLIERIFVRRPVLYGRISRRKECGNEIALINIAVALFHHRFIFFVFSARSELLRIRDIHRCHDAGHIRFVIRFDHAVATRRRRRKRGAQERDRRFLNRLFTVHSFLLRFDFRRRTFPAFSATAREKRAESRL